MIPNLNSIRAFDAAARRLNFRLAAEEMNVTQGAVAQHVRRLEADLGVKLFQREARGLSLTELGRRYHPAIRRALAGIEEATADLAPSVRRVTMSVPPSFAAKWLAPRLARFAEAHPDIELQTVASEALSDFRQDGVDIAVRQGPPPSRKAALTAMTLAQLDLVVVAAKGATPAGRLADFAEAPLAVDGHDHWRALFAAAGIAHRGRATRFNQTALAIDAAANGLGYAIAPRLLVADEIANGRLAKVWRVPAASDHGFHLIHPVAEETAARAAVVAWIVAEVKQSA
ncbi:MAG: LysR substrate-binding domain-containing protein [Pseudomonadota bacterium]